MKRTACACKERLAMPGEAAALAARMTGDDASHL
jgi:hypothetical protein